MAIKFILDNDISEDLLNIGSGHEISIKDLAIKIKKIVGYKGSLDFDNTKPDGNPRKLLDSNVINSLGWQSRVPLDEGLANSYSWFLDNIN